MSARQFSVRCASSIQPARAPTPLDVLEWRGELVAELTANGLEEVMVVPDAQGERITIRGRARAESKEDARTVVEHAIVAVTLDLIILEPGVWIDERIGDEF